MGVYKSKFTSDAITKVINNNYVTKLVKTKDRGYNSFASVISERDINGDEIDSYKVEAIEELYLHRFECGFATHEIITHYPTQYATPYDAVYDFNDQITHIFNGRRVVYTEPSGNFIAFRCVADDGEFNNFSVLSTETFKSYEITKFGG